MLGNNFYDTFKVGRLNERTFFCPKNARLFGLGQCGLKLWHCLHQLNAVSFVRKALVDLQERNDTSVFPKVMRNRLTSDCLIHCAFKQDRADDFVVVKIWGKDDAFTHALNFGEHLFL